MFDSTEDGYYRTRFLKDRYDERTDNPWETLKADAEQTSAVVRTTVEHLVATHDRIGDEELTTLYRLCHHDRAFAADRKQERVEDLDLPPEGIQEITDQIDETIGSVGIAKSKLSLSVGSDEVVDQDAERTLHDCFEQLIRDDASESELVDAADTLTEIEFHEVQSGRMSPILYYLAPTVFPITNKRSREGIERYFGVEPSRLLRDYLDEREKYLAVQDEFDFHENFRDLDWFFIWAGDDENPWTGAYESEHDRNNWQIQPGTKDHDYPEVLWPVWQDKNIISIGYDPGPVSELSGTGDLRTQEDIIVNRMSPGDIVVSKRGNDDFLGLGVVTPDGYEYRTTSESRITFENNGAHDEHPTVRSVEWILTVDTDSAIDTSDWDLNNQFHDKTVQGYKCYNELRYKLLHYYNEDLLSEFEELEGQSAKYLGETENDPKDVPPLSDEEDTSESVESDRRLVTIHVAKGSMSDHFEESVQSGVDAITISDITGTEFDRGTIRVWGNRETSVGEGTVEAGDWLLFYQHDDGYVTLAEVLGTETLGSTVATEFCREVWPHIDIDDPFDYMVYLGKVAQADIDTERLFDSSVLDFRGHPHDGWTPLDGHLDAIADEYGSIDDFIQGATDTLEYDYWDPDDWDLGQGMATDIRRQLNRKGQVIMYGPPGTGKTYSAQQFARWWVGTQTRGLPEDSSRIKSVTFHPSFSYEDFIEGYTVGDSNGDSDSGVDQGGGGQFKLKKGRFRTFCERTDEAYDNWQADGRIDDPPRFVFVIDEINRGNVAQIFGETITVLEKNKRGSTVELAHSGDPFQIPPNVAVVATMNTADQSIALVDAALRRRFASIPIMPDYGVIYRDDAYPVANDTEALELIETSRQDTDVLKAASVLGLKIINRKLLEEGAFSKGKRIGHSYLLSSEWDPHAGDAKALRDVWRFDILTLLEEYFYGNLESLVRDIFDREPEACALFDSSTGDIARFSSHDLREELMSLVEKNTDYITTQEQ
jgi:MoxR-like ATPase